MSAERMGGAVARVAGPVISMSVPRMEAAPSGIRFDLGPKPNFATGINTSIKGETSMFNLNKSNLVTEGSGLPILGTINFSPVAAVAEAERIISLGRNSNQKVENFSPKPKIPSQDNFNLKENFTLPKPSDFSEARISKPPLIKANSLKLFVLTATDMVNNALSWLGVSQSEDKDKSLDQDKLVPLFLNQEPNLLTQTKKEDRVEVKVNPRVLQPQPRPQLGILPGTETLPDLSLNAKTFPQAQEDLDTINLTKKNLSSKSHLIRPHLLDHVEPKTEENLAEEKFEPQAQAKEEGQELFEERLFIEDEEVSYQRKYEIKQAVKKAKEEAQQAGLKKIIGRWVAKLLPPEHQDVRSRPVKKKGPDGSYQETVEAIKSSGEFTSEEQALKEYDHIVEEKKPIKRVDSRERQSGRIVEEKDVQRVFKYHLVKPPLAYEVVAKRIAKKVEVVKQKESFLKTETTLEDYPQLAEIFSS